MVKLGLCHLAPHRFMLRVPKPSGVYLGIQTTPRALDGLVLKIQDAVTKAGYAVPNNPIARAKPSAWLYPLLFDINKQLSGIVVTEDESIVLQCGCCTQGPTTCYISAIYTVVPGLLFGEPDKTSKEGGSEHIVSPTLKDAHYCRLLGPDSS